MYICACIHKLEYYTSTKSCHWLLNEQALEDIMLSEISQAQKYKFQNVWSIDMMPQGENSISNLVLQITVNILQDKNDA